MKYQFSTHFTNGVFKKNFFFSDEKEEEILPLPRIEVVRRLRERLEPIILFGETEQQALKRLRAIEINEPDRIEGIKNDFKEAMDKVDKVRHFHEKKNNFIIIIKEIIFSRFWIKNPLQDLLHLKNI